jgi:homoserine kinase
MTDKYRAFAPASAANLSVGFDLLGAALKPIDGTVLGDEIVIEKAEPGVCEIRQEGRFARVLPKNHSDNIIHDGYVLYCEEAGKAGFEPCGVRMTLSKNLPVCSGLGSSASSVVAGILAVDAVNGGRFSDQQLLVMMGRLEGRISGSIHYDNAAPSFLGGLQLIVGENGVISKSLPFFKDWYIVSCFPGIKVSTNAARKILPESYPRKTVVDFGRRLAAFVAACETGDENLAAACLVDVIAEPYREKLIPGLADARAFAKTQGALATGISGSGSSIFSVVRELKAAEEIKAWLEKNFIANEDGFCHICRVDERGAYAERIKD